MTYEHQELAAGKWQKLSLAMQMANIGSEVERTMKWEKQGNREYAEKAFDRALELFDLTADDQKNKKRLKEILRARESWVDFFFGGNSLRATDDSWRKYFYPFNFKARLEY